MTTLPITGINWFSNKREGEMSPSCSYSGIIDLFCTLLLNISPLHQLQQVLIIFWGKSVHGLIKKSSLGMDHEKTNLLRKA